MALPTDWTEKVFPFLSWTSMLDRSTVMADLWAGIAAGVLILPQAIALATLAELPPEIGIYTAIFPVVICAFFGSSWHVLSGPNTSISVMIAMIVGAISSVGTPDFIIYAVTMTFLVGLIQVAWGFFKLGGVFNYFSHTVMMALVIGVGFIIIIQQLGNFFGLTVTGSEAIEDTLYSIFFRLPDANWYATSLGVMTVATGLVVRKYRPKWPNVILATSTGLIGLWLFENVFFGENMNIDKLGYLSLDAIPFSMPDFSPTTFYEVAEALIMGSFMIAFLGLMQSAVIARAMAVKSGQTIDINQEVIGQGLSNLGGAFMSCYPSCGSFNRSAANFEAGGRTPLTGIISAIALALLVILATPVLAHLPLSVVAGVLFLVGIGLIDVTYIKKVISVRGTSRNVFLLTLFVTVYGGLEWAVMLGIFLSIVVYLRSVSRPEIDIVNSNEAHQYLPEGVSDEDATVVHMAGSIFFGSTATLERIFADIASQDDRKNALIIAGEYIDNMDEAGATSLINESLKRKQHGGAMYMWLRNDKLDDIMISSGLRDAIGADNIMYVISAD
jgi:SulP family sulfate permease